MRRKFEEKQVDIFVPAAYENVMVRDSRNQLLCGTVKIMCKQFGTRVKKQGELMKISGPADRMQRCLERLHYGRIPYSVGSPP